MRIQKTVDCRCSTGHLAENGCIAYKPAGCDEKILKFNRAQCSCFDSKRKASAGLFWRDALKRVMFSYIQLLRVRRVDLACRDALDPTSYYKTMGIRKKSSQLLTDGSYFLVGPPDL